MTNYLIVPGLGNSGPEHWQTYFQHSNKCFFRIEQREWEKPICDEWIETIDKNVLKFELWIGRSCSTLLTTLCQFFSTVHQEMYWLYTGQCKHFINSYQQFSTLNNNSSTLINSMHQQFVNTSWVCFNSSKQWRQECWHTRQLLLTLVLTSHQLSLEK